MSIRRYSVLDGLRSSLFKFIQKSMSVKVVVRDSRDIAEFVGVKEMYSLYRDVHQPTNDI